MFTIVFFTKRKAGVSRAEFEAHYLGAHFELASAMPGLISYRQQPIIHDHPWAGRGTDTLAGYDAVSEYTFESHAAADSAFASPEGQLVNADADLFMDGPSVLAVPVTPTQTFSAPHTQARSRN